MNDYGILLTGTQSAQWYIKQIQIEYAEMHGSDHFFRYLAVQCDFPPINKLLPNQMKEAAALIQPYFTNSALTNCDSFILANITLHEAVSKFVTPLPKSFISIENIIAEQKLSLQLPYFILGTTYSMNSNYLKNIFQENGAAIKTLESTLIQAVDQLRIAYYQEPNPKMATEVFSQLARIEGIFIIACTELAMAYEDSQVKPPVLHLPRLQLRSLIESAVIR